MCTCCFALRCTRLTSNQMRQIGKAFHLPQEALLQQGSRYCFVSLSFHVSPTMRTLKGTEYEAESSSLAKALEYFLYLFSVTPSSLTEPSTDPCSCSHSFIWATQQTVLGRHQCTSCQQFGVTMFVDCCWM